MVGEKILDRAEKRILGGWAKGRWEVGRYDPILWLDRVEGKGHDGGADVAYCLTGAIGWNNDAKPGPGLRLVIRALAQALPQPYQSMVTNDVWNIIRYNDHPGTTFRSILGTIRRAKKILPTLQPNNSSQA